MYKVGMWYKDEYFLPPDNEHSGYFTATIVELLDSHVRIRLEYDNHSEYDMVALKKYDYLHMHQWTSPDIFSEDLFEI